MDLPPSILDDPLVLDRYQLGPALGSGATSTVHRALDRRTGQAVAVKRLHRDPTHDALRERAALALLDHPGVVRLLDHGTHHGHLVLVLELVEGTPFPGPATTWEALQPLVVQLLDTLAATHRRGIVHRDLKPAHVLVVPGRGVVLLDFGLARGDALGTTGSITGSLVGTPRYMAPEQLLGHTATPTTDLYAVGLMIYQALTGQLPHDADTAALLWSRRLSEPAPPLAALRPDLTGIASWVDRLLARSVAERPASAWEALRALRQESLHIPHLGPCLVDRVTDLLGSSRHIRIGGLPGTGRSRLLEAVVERLERPVVRLVPSVEPFGSFDGIGFPDDLEDPIRWLETALPPGAILVADPLDGLDAWSRGYLERSDVTLLSVGRHGDVEVPLLTPRDLLPLFSGTERVLHERTDAAHELHRRTRGIARGVRETLEQWYQAGHAEIDGSHFRVSRTTLDALAAEDVSPWQVPDPRTPPALVEHLRWSAFVGPEATADRVARIRGTPPWRERLLRLDALEHGWLREDPTAVLVDLPPLEGAPSEMRDRHHRVAVDLPPGRAGRLEHLVLAREHHLLGEEIRVRLARAEQDGRPARGIALVTRALRALPAPLPPAAVHMLVAAALSNPPALADAREVLGLAGLRDSDADRLLAYRGRPGAEPPAAFDDLHLEVLRRGVLVELGVGNVDALVERSRLESARWTPSLRAKAADWAGLVARRRRRLPEAVSAHREALALRTLPTARFSSLVNLAEASLWNGELEAAEHHAREARTLADALRHVGHTARAERILRTIAARQGAVEPDLILADALPTDPEIQLTEMLVAARTRHPRTAELADRAAPLPDWIQPLLAAVKHYVGAGAPPAGPFDPRIEHDVQLLLAGSAFDPTNAPFTGVLT